MSNKNWAQHHPGIFFSIVALMCVGAYAGMKYQIMHRSTFLTVGKCYMDKDPVGGVRRQFILVERNDDEGRYMFRNLRTGAEYVTYDQESTEASKVRIDCDVSKPYYNRTL